jgi:hypothetical protein
MLNIKIVCALKMKNEGMDAVIPETKNPGCEF